MKLRLASSLIFLFSCLSLTIAPSIAATSKKKPKVTPGIKVSAEDFFETTLQVVVKKKSYTQTVACYDKSAGTVKTTKAGTYFLSFAKQISQLKKDLLKARAVKTKRKIKNKIALLKALHSVGKDQCSEPAHLSLQRYNGEWTERQVRRVLEVFALGGKEEDVSRYVSMGLDKTVDDLLTPKPDGYADSFIAKLSCDPDPDDGEQECYRKGNPNDYYLDGLITAYNLKLIYTNNPVQRALWLFAMDERAPGNPRVLNYASQWMFKGYLDMVDRFAQSGDAKQYVIDYASNSFAHGMWLSGTSNHRGMVVNGAGNQDFGRELMELVSIGTRDWNGQPTYNDLDVEMASRACSGLGQRTESDAQDNDITVVGFFPDLHYPGPKTLFAGTPYQLTVENCDDLARGLVSVRKKQYAYELARRLWPRFISGLGNQGAILRLADRIEANDFKLYPVIKDMMKSKAFYAPESEETIIKDPQTYFVTFARMMGIPIERYDALSSFLDNLGMEAGRPPTVFGFSYNKKLLVSDVYQLSRFSEIFKYILWQDYEKLANKYGGWTFFKALIQNIARPTGDPASDAVLSLVKRLNLSKSFSNDQLNQMVQFLNYRLYNCDNAQHNGCFINEGKWKKLYRDAIDLGDPADDFYQFKLLAIMLASGRDFQVM